MRITQTRKHLLELLKKSSSPRSADELLVNLKVNKTTVYRQLDSLTQSGILQTINFSDRKTRYELSSLHHHHHLVCNHCSSVIDITFPENLEKIFLSVSRKKHFQIKSHSLELFGICNNCQN